MSPGMYFEDFDIGYRFRTAGRTLFEADISAFIGVAGIYEELYTNIEYVTKGSLFGRRFAPGPLTFAMAEGLVIQTGRFHSTGMALLQAEIQFLSPLFVGDTIFVSVIATSKRETSKSDRGIVTFDHEVQKSTGEVVMKVRKTRMLRRRSEDDGRVV